MMTTIAESNRKRKEVERTSIIARLIKRMTRKPTKLVTTLITMGWITLRRKMTRMMRMRSGKGKRKKKHV